MCVWWTTYGWSRKVDLRSTSFWRLQFQRTMHPWTATTEWQCHLVVQCCNTFYFCGPIVICQNGHNNWFVVTWSDYQCNLRKDCWSWNKTVCIPIIPCSAAVAGPLSKAVSMSALFRLTGPGDVSADDAISSAPGPPAKKDPSYSSFSISYVVYQRCREIPRL